MRVLLIAPYPPPFDTRTRAAVQEVRRLRAAGDHVEVLTPTPTAATHHRELHSWAACASIARVVRGFDRVLVAEDFAALLPLRAALRAARSGGSPARSSATSTRSKPRTSRAIDAQATHESSSR